MSHNPTVVFRKPGDVVIEDRPKPLPDRGELLIQTHRTLISTGTELTILNGDFPSQSAWSQYGKFPFEPGYSNVGAVIEVGKEIAPEWVGRRVASYGVHSAYVKASAQAVHLIPPSLSDEQAVFFTIAEIVMNGVRRGNIQLGETVVVYGLGLLGQLTAQFCALCGARPVVGVDVSSYRLSLLPRTASIVPVDSGQEDIAEEVSQLTGGRMANVVFEVTGNPHLIPQELALLRRQGRFVVLSSPRGPTSFDFHDLCNAPSFTIIGAHNNSHPENETLDNPWTKERNVALFFDLVADGGIDVESLVSHHAPFSQAIDLYQMLTKDRSQAMGVILEWT